MNYKKVKFIALDNCDSWKKEREDMEKQFVDDFEKTDAAKELKKAKENLELLKKDEPAYVQAKETLYDFKRLRQIQWIDKLTQNVVKRISADIEKSGDVLNIVMLPEFFWYDVDYKYINKITDKRADKYYTKPLYEEVANDMPYYLFSELTAKYENLIIFAGTVRWKEVKFDNSQEKIYNSLLIMANGKVKKWTKIYTSGIDGYTDKLAKIPAEAETKSKNNTMLPIAKYKDVLYSFDICLDFSEGYSKKQLADFKTDIHLLSCAGMTYAGNEKNITADILSLRCDALNNNRCQYIDLKSATIVDVDKPDNSILKVCVIDTPAPLGTKKPGDLIKNKILDLDV